MKNIVEIIYPKSERYPQISINGEKISRYMELSDLIYDDMFNWAASMFQSMDDELCEKYEIQLTGHPFHHQILLALKNQSEYCEEIHFTPLQYTIAPDDLMSYATTLNRNHRLGVPFDSASVVFQSDDPAQFSDILTCSTEPANYYVTTGDQFPSECKYCVTVSENISFRRKHGVSYITVPRQLLAQLQDYLNHYHIMLGFVNGVFSAARELTLDDAARLEFEAFTQEEYRILPEPIPSTMEVGDVHQLQYTYFPQCFPDPGLTCTSSAPNVVFANGSTLTAATPGSATVHLVDSLGKTYESITIHVEQHSYVSNISIVLPATTMLIGEKLRFQCFFSPSDAEDLNTVRYTISDERIAAFSAPNELYAMGPGRIKVTVSTPRVSSSFFVSILPNASDVLLADEYLELPTNSIADIHCTVAPIDAHPRPEAIWISSDPSVIRISAIGNYACKVVTGREGTATLTCQLNGTNIRKSMTIQVDRPKGCYVATAVYGSYNCPEVWMLRRYRDHFLSSHLLGRAFIRFYYAISPTAVKLFGETRWFNRICRSILDRKLRKLKAKGYADTPYND